MAGLCKTIKAGAKQLKRELTREVLKFGLEAMGAFSPLIADGVITKTEASNYAAARISKVKGIGLGAAEATVTILSAAMKAEIEDDATPTGSQIEAGSVVKAELDAAPDDLDSTIAGWIDAG